MPPIYLGSTPITKMDLGGTQLSAVYLGVQSLLSGYYATPVAIDGNYLSKTAASLTGVSDSPTGAASFFYTSNSTIGTYRTILKVGRCTVGVDDAGKIYGYMQDSTATKSITFRTPNLAQPGHYALEWDTSGAAGAKIANIYYNGAPLTPTVSDTSVGFSTNYTGTSFVGAIAAGGSPLYGDVGELLFWPGTFANWAANIGKVYSSGTPVDPGINGVTPLGVVPAVYFSCRGSALASSFASNLGSGGAFTANGLTFQRADEGLLIYGDSLAFGTGSSGPSTGWTSRVSHGLNRPIKQLNYGVGGITISNVADIMASGGFSKPAASVPVGLTKARLWALEGGYNSVATMVANGLASALTPFAASMVNTMLSLDPSAKWIFLGIPTGNITVNNAANGDWSSLGNGRNVAIVAANAWLAEQYGTHFLDLNAWLINNGLSIGNFGSPITPTATDLNDIANNVVPSSLRSPDGSVHWNDYGHYAVSVAVLQKLQALGYD